MSDVWMLVLVVTLFGCLALLMKLCDSVRSR